MRKTDTRTLTGMALLAALQVVLARLLVPMPNATTRFSIEAVPIVISGYLFGPIPGMIVGFVGDFVGTLFSGYGYNPLFAVPPMLYGLCAGMLRKPVIRKCSFINILLSILPAAALGSVLWQSKWLSFFYSSRSFMGFLAMRAVQFAVTVPVDAVIIRGLFGTRVFENLGLWPPHNA